MNEKTANEMTEKLKGAKSTEELLAVLSEYGTEVSEEEAKAMSDRMNTQGELDDDALENVAGGMNIDWSYITNQIQEFGPDILKKLISALFCQ